jgi:hypothetical protein
MSNPFFDEYFYSNNNYKKKKIKESQDDFYIDYKMKNKNKNIIKSSNGWYII